MKLNTQRNFGVRMSAAPGNFAQNKNITIYTTTHMHTSNVIIQLYMQKNVHTSLSQLKNILHQVGSLYPLVKSESSRFKHRLKISIAMYMWDVIYHHQRNILFLLSAHDFKDSNQIFF